MVTINGEAQTLLYLIYGTEDLVISDKSEAISVAVDCMGLTEEAKADLYSLLEESLTADMPYPSALSAIKAAITRNKERYPHG
jgi:hypothetical protein